MSEWDTPADSFTAYETQVESDTKYTTDGTPETVPDTEDNPAEEKENAKQRAQQRTARRPRPASQPSDGLSEKTVASIIRIHNAITGGGLRVAQTVAASNSENPDTLTAALTTSKGRGQLRKVTQLVEQVDGDPSEARAIDLALAFYEETTLVKPVFAVVNAGRNADDALTSKGARHEKDDALTLAAQWDAAAGLDLLKQLAY